MSTHFGNRIPSNEWFIFDAFNSKYKGFTPRICSEIYKKGFRKIYLSMGMKYACDQRKLQSLLEPDDYDWLQDIEFDVVMIDSLNPPYQSIMKMFPTKLLLIGNETGNHYSEGTYNTYNSSNSTNPSELSKSSKEYSYYKEFLDTNPTSYSEAGTYTRNCWNIIFEQPLELTQKEKNEKQIQADLDSSPFKKIIEVISKYSNINWTCSTALNQDIPDEKFNEQFHFIPQTVIKVCPIKYTFQGKEYEGGSIVRPIEAVERLEFENFFGFSSHCSNFNANKTRYFYSGTMPMRKNTINSIYDFLDDFQEAEYSKEFYKFLVWSGINYMGVLNSHKETQFMKELANVMEQEPLTSKELESLIYPTP